MQLILNLLTKNTSGGILFFIVLQDEFRVAEDAMQNDYVGEVLAEDPDENPTIYYSIIGTTCTVWFYRCMSLTLVAVWLKHLGVWIS